MIAATPGMPDGDGATARRAPGRGRARGLAPGCRPAGAVRPRRGAAARALGGQRHHDRFDARHGADRRLGALAHRFPCFDRGGSTVIEKNTLPSLATISESFPVAGSGAPSGPEILPSAARTSSLRSAMAPYIGPPAVAVNGAR